MTKFSVVYVVIVLLAVSYDSIQSVFCFCTSDIIITKTATTSSTSRIYRRSLFGDGLYYNDNPLNFFGRCCITQLFETTNAKYDDMMDGESSNNNYDKEADDDDDDEDIFKSFIILDKEISSIITIPYNTTNGT